MRITLSRVLFQAKLRLNLIVLGLAISCPVIAGGFFPGGSLTNPHVQHTPSVLADSRDLIAGVNWLEIYSSDTGKSVSPAGQLLYPDLNGATKGLPAHSALAHAGKPVLSPSAEVEVVTETNAATTPLAKPDPVPERGGVAGEPLSVFLSVNHEPEGDGPIDLAYTPDGDQVLVVHRLTNNIVFFDADARVATHVVEVGEHPLSVATTPDGQYAVTANSFDDSVSIVDVTKHVEVAQVPITGSQPYRVKVTADGNYAVVGVINDGVNSTFSIIDLHAQEEIRSFSSAPQGQYGGFAAPESGIQGPAMTHFALTPDSARIVQPHRSGAEVHIYEVSTGDLIETIETANTPTRVDISADGTLALIQNDWVGVTLIDLTTYTNEGFYPADSNGNREALLTHDNNYAIVGNENDLLFINLQTGITETSVPTGAVLGLAISHDGQYAFVANLNARVIDIDSQAIVATMTFDGSADTVASPVDNKVASLNNRLRENIHFYDINGADGYFEGFAATGVPPEGDAPRDVAVAPDGSVAVAANVVSRNVSIIDIPRSGDPSVRAYVDVGERPLSVAITPDGEYALVAVADAHTLSIIDLGPDEVVATIPINDRPTRVLVSPDGETAYVLNVINDKVTFVNLDGANSSIVAQVFSGNAGSHNGYTYSEFSGMTLSPDGSVLAVAASFDNEVWLFDTQTQTQVAAVPTGTFPLSITFAPDGSHAYVALANANEVAVIKIDGGSSSLVHTISDISRPLVMHIDAYGEYLYVGNTSILQSGPRLYVISTATHELVAELELPSNARAGHMEGDKSLLYIVTSDPGILMVIDAAGPDTSVLEQHELTNGPSNMVFNEPTQTAIFPQPIPDGVDFVFFDLAEPVLAFDPESHDFDEVDIGENGAPLTALLKNTGNADATNLTFDLSVPLAVGGFGMDTDDCGDTLEAGESCEVVVTFSPSEIGPVEALIGTSSAEDAAATLSLTGAGVEPEPTIDEIFQDRFAK